MVKEKRILSYVLGWLIVGFIIIFIGFNNVYAASYTGFDFTAQLYDNLGPTLNAVTTSGPAAGTGHYEGYIGYTAYSSGGAWGISSPITLIANHTYTLTANVLNECGYPILSTYNRIGVGDTLNNAKISYQNNTNVNEVYSKAIGGSNFLIQYAFTPTINATYIVFPFATSVSCSSSRTLLEGITIEDLGIDGVTQDQINTSLNNQTNEINNSIQNSTDTITGEIDDMEQNIIDNQQVCSYIDKSNIEIDGQVLYVNGNTGNLSSMGITSYIKIDDKAKLTITATTLDAVGLCFYNINKELISCVAENSYSLNDVITIPENTSYFRATIRKATNVPTFKMCINGNQATNDKLDGIQGALTDSSAPNTSGLENSAGWLPPGPLDSILNLPLTMLNSLTNSLGKTCTPLNLTLPYVNKNIEIPCLSTIFSKITGVNGLWTWVGTIASVLILYNYLLNLYAWVDRILTLRAEFDEAMGADMANWGRL